MFFHVEVVMSGFVTHRAYGPRLSKGLRLRDFYLRRLGKIVCTSYVAMLWSLLVVFSVEEYRESFMPSKITLATCFTFTAHWLRPATWCPAPPSWTIQALIPCWLIYPLLASLLGRLERKGWAAVLILMLFLCPFMSIS